jgi:hypothetical protein
MATIYYEKYEGFEKRLPLVKNANVKFDSLESAARAADLINEEFYHARYDGPVAHVQGEKGWLQVNEYWARRVQ